MHSCPNPNHWERGSYYLRTETKSEQTDCQVDKHTFSGELLFNHHNWYALLTSKGVLIFSVNFQDWFTTERTFTTLTDVSFHTIIQYTLLCSPGLEIQF